MRKTLLLPLCAAMLLTLAACGSVKNVRTEEVASELYSQKDIDSAIGVIKKEFVQNWDGCTLTEISYAGDDVSEKYPEWAERNDADEVIVLTSSFDVAEQGASPSLDPGNTYTRWMWILVRSNGGAWRHVDHGY